MDGSSRHIVCPHCGSVNRIPVGKPAGKAKCGHCHQPLFTGHPNGATADQFIRQIQRSDIPVVVDFWADWCGPCHAMAPHYDRLAAELEPEMRFLKIDTEQEPGLAAQYGIRSIPTLMVFAGGRLVAQQAGALSATQLRAWLQQNAKAA
jgi:thioredoxin 2